MAKAKKSVFFCQNCGHEESKWLGQCPMCKEWNSFVEECVTTSKTAAVKAAKEIRIVPLSEVNAAPAGVSETGKKRTKGFVHIRGRIASPD